MTNLADEIMADFALQAKAAKAERRKAWGRLRPMLIANDGASASEAIELVNWLGLAAERVRQIIEAITGDRDLRVAVESGRDLEKMRDEAKERYQAFDRVATEQVENLIADFRVLQSSFVAEEISREEFDRKAAELNRLKAEFHAKRDELRRASSQASADLSARLALEQKRQRLLELNPWLTGADPAWL